VVETCPPRYDEAVALWAALLATDFGAVMDRLLPIMGTDGRVFAERFIATAGRIESVQEFSRKLVERDGIARAWSQFMATHPLLLTPTWTQLPFVHGFDVMSVENGRAVLELVRAVLPANLLGLPSACVPAGLDRATGLPVGVLVTGQRFREDLCLQAAERREANSGVDTPIEPRRAQRWV
jgi:amidase